MTSEWDVLWRLVLALVLSSVIGLEREMRQKSAGLRTYTLVGVGSALFVLVSAYGFSDVLAHSGTRLDPSRVAAQVVTGIGFIGGGLIFVRRDAVRGLTTAAGVWVTAAVGMAAAANLPVLATGTTVIYLIVAYGYAALTPRLPRSRYTPTAIELTYLDGHGILRDALTRCTEAGFSVADVAVKRDAATNGNGRKPRTVAVQLQLRGVGSVLELATELEELDGMIAVSAADANAPAD
jgi:putative Mg2+ transporter-C (MgtC) family protein